jgi:hypothetical protein
VRKIIELGYREQALSQRVALSHRHHDQALNMITASTSPRLNDAIRDEGISTACQGSFQDIQSRARSKLIGHRSCGRILVGAGQKRSSSLPQGATFSIS